MWEDRLIRREYVVRIINGLRLERVPGREELRLFDLNLVSSSGVEADRTRNNLFDLLHLRFFSGGRDHLAFFVRGPVGVEDNRDAQTSNSAHRFHGAPHHFAGFKVTGLRSSVHPFALTDDLSGLSAFKVGCRAGHSLNLAFNLTITFFGDLEAQGCAVVFVVALFKNLFTCEVYVGTDSNEGVTCSGRNRSSTSCAARSCVLCT